jgi:hypothetical protein
MNPVDKCCAECGEDRPNEPLHFPVFRKKNDTCLACVTKHKMRLRAQKEERRSRRMGKMEEQAVDAMLDVARRGGGNIPHSAELLEQVMTFFGGVNGFSSILLKQYFDSTPGSPQRTKMLEMVTRLVTTNADQGGSKKPLTFWSEEELNAELDERLAQAVEQMIPHEAPRVLEVEHHAAPAEHSIGE